MTRLDTAPPEIGLTTKAGFSRATAWQRLWRAVSLAGFALMLGAGEDALAQAVLLDPATVLGTATRHDFVGASRLRAVEIDGKPFLEAVPNRSASGLYQPAPRLTGQLGHIRWWWRVDRLQASADIRRLDRDDFGALLAFVFGEPSWWNRDVPTIAYVWTATALATGTLVKSPRHDNVYYVQLRGRADIGTVRQEDRDVAADFLRAFGRSPPNLRYVAIFNDNDQTGEAVEAFFGPVVTAR